LKLSRASYHANPGSVNAIGERDIGAEDSSIIIEMGPGSSR
jgi:hypothetical protein